MYIKYGKESKFDDLLWCLLSFMPIEVIANKCVNSQKVPLEYSE